MYLPAVFFCGRSSCLFLLLKKAAFLWCEIVPNNITDKFSTICIWPPARNIQFIVCTLSIRLLKLFCVYFYLQIMTTIIFMTLTFVNEIHWMKKTAFSQFLLDVLRFEMQTTKKRNQFIYSIPFQCTLVLFHSNTICTQVQLIKMFRTSFAFPFSFRA